MRTRLFTTENLLCLATFVPRFFSSLDFAAVEGRVAVSSHYSTIEPVTLLKASHLSFWSIGV